MAAGSRPRRPGASKCDEVDGPGGKPDSTFDLGQCPGTVTVDDAGPGIPPCQAKSLFERCHSGSGSSGLGLSIADRVAHAHGDSLTVVPGGARFLLSVPVRDQGRP
ncbi:ATP-binding protein [Streptomyces sp. NPDC101152]|uniref:ATP-binding protein n=1 Tax=Streptomyces sp. NPDC101152 TaxID=3366116 RepID=UPI00380FBFA2